MTIVPNPHTRSRLPWVVYGIAIVLCLALYAFLHVGRWLVVEDPLRPAAAIAVFSGQMPERALEAARIYKQGYAPRVWLTYSTEPAERLKKLSVPYKGEEEYNKEILAHEGVPESAIEILEPPIINTADEVRAFDDALKKERQGAIILVTSRVHTRRVRALWHRLAENQGTAIVRGVSEDAYDAEHWWRNTRDALDVVREVLGLMNVWAGLPVRSDRK